MLYYLYWDESDGNDPTTTKLRRAIYDSLEAAQEQAAADKEHGRSVLCIEKSEKPLGVSAYSDGSVNHVTFERGTEVK